MIVFLSILKGVENSWINKLTTLQAPIRLVPNERYYNSPYFQLDATKDENFYQHKTLFEKSRTKNDEDLDIIFELKNTLSQLNLSYDIYEVTAGILKVQLAKITDGRIFESTITQATYLTNTPTHSKSFQKILSPLDEDDLLGLRKFGAPSELIVISKDDRLEFPTPTKGLEPVLLPKNFKEAGVKAGDRVEININQAYSLTGASPVLSGYVCGFYDPGMMSVGTRVAFLREELIEQMISPEQAPSLDPLLKGGFFVYLNEIDKTPKITELLKKNPIMNFFDVIPYYEFAFAKEIMLQFQSDQILFSLIGFVILMIACLNIIAALVLIVQEKKGEIGLLLALGASKKQIQFIFGSLGFLIGLAGFIIGTTLATITLYKLEWIIQKMLFLKGHPAIRALSFDANGSIISLEIIGLALLITPLLAMIAGLIPAKQALKIEPVEILKNG